MSDGISDASRGDNYFDLATFYRVLADYLITPNIVERTKLLEAGLKTNMFGRRIAEHGADAFKGIVLGDKNEWAKLLVSAERDTSRDCFARLQNFSPFKSKAILHLKHHYNSGLDQILRKRLEQLGLSLNDGSDYLLFVDPWVLDNIRVVKIPK